eukprot:1191655-Prorocentrum_minimum.AAC.2
MLWASEWMLWTSGWMLWALKQSGLLRHSSRASVRLVLVWRVVPHAGVRLWCVRIVVGRWVRSDEGWRLTHIAL